MPINARCKVLVKDGNRFTFRSLCDFYDDPNRKFATSFWSEAQMIALALNAEIEQEWLEFDQDHFPHVVGDLISRGFAHGAATAMIISGPWFDETINKNDRS